MLQPVPEILFEIAGTKMIRICDEISNGGF